MGARIPTAVGILLMLYTAPTSAIKVTVCYYTNWCQYTAGKGRFLPTHLDKRLCTHINYAFTDMKDNKMVWIDGDEDPITVAAIRKRLQGTGAKVFLSIGGWTFDQRLFSAMAASKVRRTIFANSAIAMLRQHGLQGLDIDWEYPAQRGGVPADKANFVTLLRELRAAFIAEGQRTKRARLQLSVAVAAPAYTVATSYNVAGISGAVDLLNIMAYDYAGPSWMSVTGHLAPLSGHSGDYVSRNVQQWLAAGANPAKTVLGIPTYAATWRLKDSRKSGAGAAATGPGPAGPYTQTAGSLSYFEVKALPNARTVYDSTSMASCVVSGSTWASVETATSATRKGAYIKSKKLAGAMFWELSQDEFQGGRFPLIRAVKAAMV